jgi:hemoglobin/transferrin/lactoferrin receptor protein
LIDPTLLEAVRIDASVAAADVGPGALGGALDYQTRDVGDLLDAGDNSGGFYKLEHATNGDILTNSLALYGQEGGFEVLGFARYSTGDNLVDGTGTDIIGSGSNLTSFLGKLAYESESGNRFEFSMEEVTDDELRPYRANIGDVVGGRPVPVTRNYDLTRTNCNFEYTTTRPSAV